MSIAPYLREIGRGKEGARALSREQAEDLMTQVLDDRVDPVSLGAFAIAMRIKGETPDELHGFVQAARRHLMALPAGSAPVVWLPSYNGGRKLPNLTPLLAQLLAHQGLQVVVHGVVDDGARITTHQLFQALGWPVCHTPEAVAAAWASQRPAFVPIAHLNPALARLLALRQVLGLRNPAHSIAKLLSPAAGLPGPRHFRVVNHTHPEYAESLSAFLQLDAADAMLLRGTEGEPVADLRRAPAMQCFRQGRPDHHHPLQSGSLAPVDLGDGRRCDLAHTLVHIAQRLSGEQPVPEPIRLQVDTVVAQLR
ncbi:MAG: DNA-binding protein YbiB [Pseudomonadota bacterium]